MSLRTTGATKIEDIKMADPAGGRAARLIEGNDEPLAILSEQPAVLETPRILLAGHTIPRLLILFVTNIQDLPEGLTLQPLSFAGWDFELYGLIGERVTICVEELVEMEQVEYEMVLQCAGNGRSDFSQAFPIPGTAWGQGGIGNVRFAGVPLSAVLKKHNVKINREAKFLTAESKDLRLADRLEKSILALRLNGEVLLAAHGGRCAW